MLRVLTTKPRPRILLVGFGLEDLPFERKYLSSAERTLDTIYNSYGHAPNPPSGVEAVNWHGFVNVTLYDYDVIIMDLASADDRSLGKRLQLDEFLYRKDGALLLCVCARHNLAWPKLIPSDVEIKVVSEPSEEYDLHLRDLLSWPFSAGIYTGQGFYFNGRLPANKKVIAVNKKGKVLSFAYRRGNGRVILWPEVRQKKEIVKFALDRVVPEFVGVPKPEWVDKVMMHDEKCLRAQLLETQRKIEDYQKWKVLLYGGGPQLCKIVKESLNFLGVKASDPRQCYDHDLEVELPGGLVGIVEVTGSTGTIDVDKVHQLLQFVTAVEKETPPRRAKGILIANPQRDKLLEQRDHSFTEKAVERARMNEFCLYTTLQLYESLEAFLKGERVAEQLVKTLSETKGAV